MFCLQDNVLPSRQCIVFKTMSCLQDNVLSSWQCIVCKTLSCLWDTVLPSRQCCGEMFFLQKNVLYSRQCLAFETLSCLLDNVVPFSMHKLRFGLRPAVKCGLISHFVLPKVVCLAMLIQAVPTFCRPCSRSRSSNLNTFSNLTYNVIFVIVDNPVRDGFIFFCFFLNNVYIVEKVMIHNFYPSLTAK